VVLLVSAVALASACDNKAPAPSPVETPTATPSAPTAPSASAIVAAADAAPVDVPTPAGVTITKVAPGSATADVAWGRKLSPADAKASFEADFRKRTPGTSYTEAAAGISITYSCVYDKITVDRVSSKTGAGYKATVRAHLPSLLTGLTPAPQAAEDTGTFVFYPAAAEEGRWACDPKASNGRATLGQKPGMPLALPCWNLATQCLGRHPPTEESDIAMGK
jgi:hypothetical protein